VGTHGLKLLNTPLICEKVVVKNPLKRSKNNEEEETGIENTKHNLKRIKWEPNFKKINPVILEYHHYTIKERQEAIIDKLFDRKSMQCKNCGLRFSPNDLEAYRNHLDWHFQVNMKKKEDALWGTRKQQSRSWYSNQSEWTAPDEIHIDDKNEQNKSEKEQKIDTIPSIPALMDKEICGVCNEEFSQEYKDDEIGYLGYINFENKTPFESSENEDNSDQWHLINAIRPNGPKGKAYHSQCYKDKQKQKCQMF